MANFAINGFGRIGRNVLRAMSQKQVERVVAINDLTDTHTLAHLLKWDSVHGKFDGEISYDDENIIVRGHKIKILKDRDPGNLPWKKLDIDVVLESTGLFTSRDKAELHLKAGAKRVLISAPAKDPDVTICIGVNDDVYDPNKDKIVSNASCTTNCLAPMAKVLNDTFGIAHGFMSTIHSYTNDQRILDFPHSDLRRARSAAINIIPVLDWRSKGDWRSNSSAQRKIKWRRVPGADARWFGDGFHCRARKRRDRRRRSMPPSRKRRQIKATKACSNSVTNRSFRRTSLAIRTPASSTAS